jgi:hypothetical protein
MISDNFWKILFILMVLTGLVFWYKNYKENTSFNNTASELADLIIFTPETLPRNEEEAQQRFIKAVTLIEMAEQDRIDTSLLLEAAFEYNDIGIDSAEAGLVRNALFDSQANGKKLGIFNQESMWDLQDGQPVEIVNGPYKGEKIAIALHVPASIGEGAQLFLGNMVLVPESVAAISSDLILTEDVYNTSIKLANASVISNDAAKVIKENYYLQRERNKY